MSAMINLSASKKTDTINLDVKPVTNVHIGDMSASTESFHKNLEKIPGNYVAKKQPEVRTREIEEGVTVVYPDGESPANPYEELSKEDLSTQIDELSRENQVLKLIIEMMNNNPLIWNGFIIADDEVLIQFIKLLTKAEEVQIDADDIGQGCVTKNKYRKVHSIYVVVNGETKNLKYDFPRVNKTLLDLHISTKFIF